jgi:adenylate cyclase
MIGSVAGIAIAIFSNLLMQDVIDRLENVTYYARAKWELGDQSKEKLAKLAKAENGISIIDIDDRSMSKMGLYWNWDRSYQAKMITELSAHFPAAIVYDIFFSNPEDTNQRQRVRKLLDKTNAANPKTGLSSRTEESILSTINYDRQFIDATRKAGSVFHATVLQDESDYDFAISQVKHRMTVEWHDSLNPASAISLSSDKLATVQVKKSIIDGIFPALAQAARAIGHVQVVPNEDGVIREIPLLYRFDGKNIVYLPMSVRVAATLFGTPNEEIVFEPNRYIDIGKPFKIFKDSAGGFSCSYPNVTQMQIRALCDKSTEILSCGDQKSVDVSSFCAAARDSAGKLSLEMNAPGILPPELVAPLLAGGCSGALDLAIGAEFPVSPEISILHDADNSWIIKAPFDVQEWYCARIELETIARVKIADCDFVKPGERKLLFHTMTVRNRHGELTTSIPVLRGAALRDLCQTGWERIAQLQPGTRMDFGRSLQIPLMPGNGHIITYFGPKAKTFRNYSFYDIMENRAQGEFEGKIFIVGSTAPGLFDIKAVPHERNYPAVEIHASLLNSFMSNTFVRRLAVWQDFVILLCIAMLIGFISYLFKPLAGGLLTLGSVIAYFLVAMTLFGTEHLWIEIARPIFAMVLSFTTVMAYRYVTEEKDRKFLQSTFKQYLSPELIDIMYKQRTTPKLGGEEGVRTAYFTDIQGFSTFSEKLGSPTRLVELLNEYLSAMTTILLKRFGTLDKYEGDAIIAFFGAPMPMEDHAAQACLTALDMQEALGGLRAKWKSEGDKWPQIVHDMRMRIGLNTGLIVTGNMGSSVRMNYTMMGDAVNLAARLESAAKQYGVFTMISNFTYEMVKNDFETRMLDKITVVGKSEPVTVYELLGKKGSLAPEVQKLLEIYGEGIDYYYAREWQKAIAKMQEADTLEPNAPFTKGLTPSRKIISYCEEFLKQPPGPEWNGVSSLTSK